MEHQRFDYSPITRRPPLKFPNGARIAVWIVPTSSIFTTTSRPLP